MLDHPLIRLDLSCGFQPDMARLATYRCLDMDVTLREAMDSAEMYLRRAPKDGRCPSSC